MSGVPRQAEAYLRCATCLVPRRVRGKVQAELRGNLYQTALDARCEGLSEEMAWARALNEAGPAYRLALNLARVYLLRPMARLLLVGAALGGAAYAVQSGGHSVPATQSGATR